MYEGGVSNNVHIFDEWDFLAGKVETSMEGGGCGLSRVGSPGTLKLSRFPHP